ncbi:MAG: hypothetical protein AAFX39_12980 [Pseudomonadota bacterium]
MALSGIIRSVAYVAALVGLVVATVLFTGNLLAALSGSYPGGVLGALATVFPIVWILLGCAILSGLDRIATLMDRDVLKPVATTSRAKTAPGVAVPEETLTVSQIAMVEMDPPQASSVEKQETGIAAAEPDTPFTARPVAAAEPAHREAAPETPNSTRTTSPASQLTPEPATDLGAALERSLREVVTADRDARLTQPEFSSPPQRPATAPPAPQPVTVEPIEPGGPSLPPLPQRSRQSRDQSTDLRTPAEPAVTDRPEPIAEISPQSSDAPVQGASTGTGVVEPRAPAWGVTPSEPRWTMPERSPAPSIQPGPELQPEPELMPAPKPSPRETADRATAGPSVMESQDTLAGPARVPLEPPMPQLSVSPAEPAKSVDRQGEFAGHAYRTYTDGSAELDTEVGTETYATIDAFRNRIRELSRR